MPRKGVQVFSVWRSALGPPGRVPPRFCAGCCVAHGQLCALATLFQQKAVHMLRGACLCCSNGTARLCPEHHHSAIGGVPATAILGSCLWHNLSCAWDSEAPVVHRGEELLSCPIYWPCPQLHGAGLAWCEQFKAISWRGSQVLRIADLSRTASRNNLAKADRATNLAKQVPCMTRLKPFN